MVIQISLRMQFLKLVIRSTVHPIQLKEKANKKKKKGMVKATDRMTTMMVMVEVDISGRPHGNSDRPHGERVADGGSAAG